MTRAELRTRILDGLNDPDGVFWSAAQLNATIDEALEVLAEEAGAVRRTAYLALEPMATYYALAAVADDVLAIWRIWSVTRQERLIAVSRRELDERHQTWLQNTDTPHVWFPVDWQTFGIYPKSAAGGEVLQIDYLGWPKALDNDADEPETPVADAEAVIRYGVYDGYAKRWEAMRMVEAWSVFLHAYSLTPPRSGVGRLHRDYQAAPADTVGPRTRVRL